MLTILAVILCIIVSINLISLIINQVFFSNELENITPYGEMVEVNGQNMHIYSMGEGEKTIVLLPGFGGALPSADFGPLMRELSKNYTVVCVEYFGVGFSDETEVPRTNENVTQEIRTALSEAGYSPPYLLMPHSGSGIYTEHYASTYPDEISGIIMLDPTSSATTGTHTPGFAYGISKIQEAIGLGRYVNPLIVSSVLSMTESNGYTQQEIDDYTKFMNHVNNDNLIDQMKRLNDNILQVMDIDFPDNIPVLIIGASKTGEEYHAEHLKRLGQNAELAILEGSHYIYHSQLSEIHNATDLFVETQIK